MDTFPLFLLVSRTVVSQFGQLFAVFDRNGDGFLSREVGVDNFGARRGTHFPESLTISAQELSCVVLAACLVDVVDVRAADLRSGTGP